MPRHSRTRLPAVGVLLLSALLVLGTAGPASAARWSAPEATGDVDRSTWDSEPRPCGTFTDLDGTQDTHHDITKLAVDHTDRAVRLTLRLHDLESGRRLDTEFAVATPKMEYSVDVWRRANGSVRIFLTEQPKWPDFPGTDISRAELQRARAHARLGESDDCVMFGYISQILYCGHLTATVDDVRDLVRVRFPRSCLGSPRWVRVAADTSGWRDDESFSDRWAPDGADEAGWVGPYGPAVRRG